MLSKTIIEANKLCRYFGCDLIGSVLIRTHIDDSLINDVDVAIDGNIFFKIKNYLEDVGFKETKHSYKQKGYQDFIGSMIFEKEGFLPIHLSFKADGFIVKSNKEIWAEKIMRFSDSDVIQIKSLLERNKKRPWAK